jgi:hypothetical protein
MEYTLVGQVNRDDLERTVNDLIAEGWQPQGGIAVVQYERGLGDAPGLLFEFYQAMVRHKPRVADKA